jgi:hypothetical protein
MEFTVFALFYGDYPDLAERCLHSLKALPHGTAELRVGLNAVPEDSKTHNVVRAMVDARYLEERNIYESSENIYKYPMMRRLFHDPDNPIETPYTMWFDDDSFLRVDECGNFDNWFAELTRYMQEATMVGAVYKLGFSGNQRAYIEDQPWYNGKPLDKGFTFITGGWWCLRSSVIADFDWPVAELVHRGGDTLLGELLRQHDHAIKHFTRHLAINADAAGNQCKAPRRGFDSRPVGYDYDPGVTRQISAVMPQLQKPRLPYDTLME